MRIILCHKHLFAVLMLLLSVGSLLKAANDGDLDPSFNPGGVLPPGTAGLITTDFSGGNDGANAVAIQSDGKIVAAGVATIGGTSDFALARYNSDGSLDTSFNPGGVLPPGTAGLITTAFGTGTDQANAVAIQSDGKIVAAGFAFIDGGSGFDFALARYNTDGSLDASFNGTGKVTTDFGTLFDQANAVAIQSDGKIVAAGNAAIGGSDNFALARYNSDGSLDTSFNPGGVLPPGTAGLITTAIGVSGAARAVAIQSDGKIVAAGDAVIGGTSDFALARYNSDGSLDTSFNPGGVLPPGTAGLITTAIGAGIDQANAVAIQSDGKIVAAGVAAIGGTSDFALARYFGEQVDPFIPRKLYCTSCGPIIFGSRGCYKSLVYQVGDNVVERLYFPTIAAYEITSIEPTCYDFETTVTVVCESC